MARQIRGSPLKFRMVKRLLTLQVAVDAAVYTEMAAGDTTVGSTPI